MFGRQGTRGLVESGLLLGKLGDRRRCVYGIGFLQIRLVRRFCGERRLGLLFRGCGVDRLSRHVRRWWFFGGEHLLARSDEVLRYGSSLAGALTWFFDRQRRLAKAGILEAGACCKLRLDLRACRFRGFGRSILCLFLGPGLGLLHFQQALPVRHGDLVVVGMDFAERQEAVAATAIFHESSLQAGFYANDLGEIDVTLELLLGSSFDVEIVEPVTVQHHHAGFFRVGRVDKHTLRH